ncbi:MAG: hypothetical protein ACLU7B_06765 [Bifidobacterium adolescentis]
MGGGEFDPAARAQCPIRLVQQLDKAIEKINYASGMGEDWLLGDFHRTRNRKRFRRTAREFKEDVIDPIVAFLNGSQSRILADGLEWLKTTSQTSTMYLALRQQACTNPRNSWQTTRTSSAKPINSRLPLTICVRQQTQPSKPERANALNDVEDIRARIHDSTEYQHATQAAQAKVETELDQVAERMQRIPFIYKMRESVHELSERTYPQLINTLSSLRAETEDRARRRGAGCYSYYADGRKHS